MQQVPFSVLEIILSFVRSPKVCLVCRAWAEIAHLRYVCDGANFLTQVWSPSRGKEILSLRLLFGRYTSPPGFVDGILQRVSTLSTLTDLAVTLVDTYALGDDLMAGFASIRALRHLERLYLFCCVDGLTDVGVRSLSEIHAMTSLRDITVHLYGDNITSAGAQAMEKLRLLPSLTTLTLQLNRLLSQGVGPQGVRHLAGLHQCPSLTFLKLGLPGNDVGDEGMAHLAEFRKSSTLTHLVLDLRYNRISERGLNQLVWLQAAPKLTSLRLLLEGYFDHRTNYLFSGSTDLLTRELRPKIKVVVDPGPPGR
eukprot:RCo026941